MTCKTMWKNVLVLLGKLLEKLQSLLLKINSASCKKKLAAPEIVEIVSGRKKNPNQLQKKWEKNSETIVFVPKFEDDSDEEPDSYLIYVKIYYLHYSPIVMLILTIQ